MKEYLNTRQPFEMNDTYNSCKFTIIPEVVLYIRVVCGCDDHTYARWCSVVHILFIYNIVFVINLLSCVSPSGTVVFLA